MAYEDVKKTTLEGKNDHETKTYIRVTIKIKKFTFLKIGQIII